ncbi:MAG TPA: AbrB/MazE/SpoVT family DNA-binding domain-containing protein [Promineifilum sp.]|nr:AbrB/MazE/SpoVT family DNA-binding domain-containing protein [Promineifilum sp.]
MTLSTVSAKGWVVIPKALRQKYGLEAGSKVRFVDYRGAIYLVPIPDDPIEALYGMFAGGPSMTAELLAERERDNAHEERTLESLRSG